MIGVSALVIPTVELDPEQSVGDHFGPGIAEEGAAELGVSNVRMARLPNTSSSLTMLLITRTVIHRIPVGNLGQMRLNHLQQELPVVVVAVVLELVEGE